VQGYGNPGDEGYFVSYTAYYLEAALVNISGTRQWANRTGDLIPNLSQSSSDQTDWGIGRGKINTAIIIAHGFANGYTTLAARACSNLTTGGKTDWFLPSRDELNLLYIERGKFGNFGIDYYWSSSQAGSSLAWVHGFFIGDQGNTFKDISYSVRAIRAF